MFSWRHQGPQLFLGCSYLGMKQDLCPVLDLFIDFI